MTTMQDPPSTELPTKKQLNQPPKGLLRQLARLSYLGTRRVSTGLFIKACEAHILTLKQRFLLLPSGPEAIKVAVGVRCVCSKPFAGARSGVCLGRGRY